MKRIIYGLPVVVSILLASCNMPTENSPSPDMMTSAALTVQAVINAAPLASPTAESANAQTSEATPTYSKPLVSVGDVTNCRTGPDTNYERVTQILPGEQVEIIGFYSPNYWLVSTKAGICWLYGDVATPMGSFAAVPTVTAPPTSTGKPPEGVSLQKWNIACDYVTNRATVYIQWSDKDTNETGYRIYRNGNVIAELPANSTEFSEIITLLSGQSAGYSVEVFSPAGSVGSKTITLSC